MATVADLCENFTKVGLVRECEKRSLPTDGSKSEMAKRIVEHRILTAAKKKKSGNDADGDDDGSQPGDDDRSGDDGSDDDGGGNESGDGENDDSNAESENDESDAQQSDADDEQTERRHAHQRPQVYSFRDMEESIESFGAEDGDDVRVWLCQLEAVAKSARWTDEHKLVMCRKKLTGTARRFVFSIRDVNSYAKLKKALIGEFAPFVRASDVHRTLASRKKKSTETTRDYIYEMQKIALAIDLDEPSLCEYIVDGITDDEFHRSLLYEAQTIRRLKEKLLNFEKVTKNSRKKTKQDDGGKKEKLRTENKGGTKSDQKKHCFNCGDASHVASECPQKNDGPKCFNCNAFGHLSKECPKNKKPKEKKVNVVEKVSSDDKPGVPLKLFGREFPAIIDTGAEISLLRKDLWMDLAENGVQMRKSNMKVRGYGGDVRVVCGEVTLTATIREEEFQIHFYVVPDEAIDMQVLIGMDFLNDVDYTISPGEVRVKKYRSKELEPAEADAKWIRRVAEYVVDDEVTVPHQYRDKVMELIENYAPEKPVVAANQLTITLSDNDVVCENPRRLAQLEKEVVKKQISEWLEEGIIQPSQSEYASPVVVVPKKDGSYRVCIDYRELNKKIVRDKFPMPNVEEQIDQLSEARVYTTLDLKNSYFHVPVEEKSRKYTAFVASCGQYEFLRAPFGLCTSGSGFGRFISAVLKDFISDGSVMAFVDDIIIPTKNEEDGLKVLKSVLEVAAKAGLQFNWKKCVFLQRRVEYLGYTIYDGRVEPAPAKIEKLKQFPQPTTAKQLQRFYGLASYFARPLSDLLKKDKFAQFDDAAVYAFNRIKEILASYPVLRIFRPDGDVEVHTDASKIALAGILMQRAEDDGKFHPCYYFSRLTSGAEKNYHSFELEALAVVEAVQKFRCYLLGRPFKIITDCMAFKDSVKKKKLNARIAKYVVALSEFQYTIEHRPGEKLPHVDALSRADVLVVSAPIVAKIRAAQQEDDRGKALMAALEQSDSVEGFTTSNGILYEGEGESRRLYVPESMETEIIRSAHEQGHFGVRKTRERIKADYHISGLEDKIKRCIATCVPCIVGEKKRGKPEGELCPIPKGDVPLDTLHVDHLGPMPSTRKSYGYILTVIDAFTKFVWLFATKSTTAEEAVKKLRVITDTFGNPRRIICDRGAAFTSGFFTKFCDEEGIDLHTIVTGVPRGNGQVERVHRIIIPMITKLAVDKPEEWFKHVAVVQKYLNNSWQRAISMTPFELLIGVKMRTKEDAVLHEMLLKEIQDSFIEDRNELRTAAQESIQKMQEENRKYYNLRRKPYVEYKVGDLVAIPKTQFGVGQKVKPRFFGPYEITGVLPNSRYEVRKLDDDAEGPKKTSTAGDQIKPWSLPGRK